MHFVSKFQRCYLAAAFVHGRPELHNDCKPFLCGCKNVVVVSRSKTQTLDAWKCNQPEIGRELIKREASVHGKAKEPGENEAKWWEAMVTCSVNHPLGRQHSAILFGLQILHQWDFRRALSNQTFQVVIWNIFRGLTWSCLVPSWCWC